MTHHLEPIILNRAVIGDELGEDVWEHLASCPDCLAKLEAMSLEDPLVISLSKMPKELVPEGLSMAVLTAWQEELGEQAWTRDPAQWSPAGVTVGGMTRWLRPLGALVVADVALLLALVVQLGGVADSLTWGARILRWGSALLEGEAVIRALQTVLLAGGVAVPALAALVFLLSVGALKWTLAMPEGASS